MNVISRMEAAGYRVQLRADGQIALSLPGGLPPPPDADELIAACRENKEAVKFFLEAREQGFKAVLHPMQTTFTEDIEDAKALKRAEDNGDIEIVGNVVYYRKSGKISIDWRPTHKWEET